MIFPIENVFEYLVEIHSDTEFFDDTIIVKPANHAININVQSINEVTKDNLTVSEIVTLQSAVPAKQNLDINTINNHTMNCCAQFDEDADLVIFTSRICIFETDVDAAVKLYAPMIAHQAATLDWHVNIVLHQSRYESDAAESPVSTWDESIPDLQHTLELAHKRFTDLGLCTNVEGNTLICEFPWEEGAYSRGFSSPEMRSFLLERGMSDDEITKAGGLTSLLTIKEAHDALYGRGLKCELIIPLDGNYPDSWKSGAQLLNFIENTANDWPPLIGAWYGGERGITFSSFVPTCFYLPGLAYNFATWSMRRSIHVREFIENSAKQLSN